MIAGIVLAAGASRRFGGDKLAAPLAGRPVVRWSADAVAPWVDVLVVVTSPAAARVRAALGGLPVRWAINSTPDDGMASSIRCGVAALPAGVEAAVLALGDQPLLDPEVVHGIAARWRSGGAKAVAARYDDGRGHPVLFGASLFAPLLALTGDRGARDLLDALGADLALVPVAGDQPLDVDTPALLRAAEEALLRRTIGA